LNSDNEFVVFRRFGRIHARLLLHKQTVILKLEEKLDAIDEAEENAYKLKSRGADDNVERNQVLVELEARILEYGKTYYLPVLRNFPVTKDA
jgi:hypothetical protein